MGTVMNVKRTSNESSGGGSTENQTFTQLIEKRVVITVSADERRYVAVPVGLDKYELKTVTAFTDTGVEYLLEVYDSANEDTQLIQYRSLQETETFDTVLVPIVDKDGTDNVHLYVSNKSATISNITVILKLINYV